MKNYTKIKKCKYCENEFTAVNSNNNCCLDCRTNTRNCLKCKQRKNHNQFTHHKWNCDDCFVPPAIIHCINCSQPFTKKGNQKRCKTCIEKEKRDFDDFLETKKKELGFTTDQAYNHYLDLERQKETIEWKMKYTLYLDSLNWKTKREQVLQRDNYRCVRCQTVLNLQVHHKTYKNLYNEPLEDLETLCRNCHKEHHGLNR